MTMLEWSFESSWCVQMYGLGDGSVAVDDASLERVLLPSGVRPDRLDVALSWHLHSLLAAIRALPSDAATYQVLNPAFKHLFDLCKLLAISLMLQATMCRLCLPRSAVQEFF